MRSVWEHVLLVHSFIPMFIPSAEAQDWTNLRDGKDATVKVFLLALPMEKVAKHLLRSYPKTPVNQAF